jgi:hypothetical protein
MISAFGGILLAILLTLSAFAATHIGVKTQAQVSQQSLVSGAMLRSRSVHTQKRDGQRSSQHKVTHPQKKGIASGIAQMQQAKPYIPPTPVATTPPTPVVTTPPAPVSTPQPVVTPAPTQQPVSTPQPVVTPAPTGGNSGSVTAMIEQVFGANAPTAIQVATCESGLNPNAYNATSIGGSHAAGIFQILYPSTWYTTPQGAAGLSPYNAMANIEAAYSIFVRDGYSWREWTCR